MESTTADRTTETVITQGGGIYNDAPALLFIIISKHPFYITKQPKYHMNTIGQECCSDAPASCFYKLLCAIINYIKRNFFTI